MKYPPAMVWRVAVSTVSEIVNVAFVNDVAPICPEPVPVCVRSKTAANDDGASQKNTPADTRASSVGNLVFMEPR